jgi:Tol biopolymer transport system component
MLPTTPHGLTAQGTILGTLQYMAPEQLEGREADARSDVFAFGAIVYEMVTGKRAFDGTSPASIVAAILDHHPPVMSSVEALTPAPLDHLVARCLSKVPEARWQTATDVMYQLKWIAGLPASAPAAAPIRATGELKQRLMWLAAGVLVALGLAAGGVTWFRSSPADLRPIRFPILAPPGVIVTNGTNNTVAVVSPDGRRVAFIGQRAGVGAYQLWVRSLDSLEAYPLAGTDAATLPFWSPDSRMLAFFAFGQLKAVDASGGPVQKICDTPTFRGGSWSSDGTIVFGSGITGPRSLNLVPAAGGQPVPLALSQSLGTIVPSFPAFLPDGRRFLYLASPSSSVWVGSIDSSETTRVVNADSQAQYVAPGRVIFVRQGTLFEQPFDVSTATATGTPTAVAEQISADPQQYAAFSASENGTLVYRTGGPNAVTQLTSFDRRGVATGVIGTRGAFRNPMLSRDGTRVAVEETDPQSRTQEVWIFDVARGTRSRFTFDPGNDIYPVWSPDDSRIMFASDRDGKGFALYSKPANGSGDEQVVGQSLDPMAAPYDWSLDGRFVVLRSGVTGTALLPLADGGEVQPLLASATAVQVYAQISPDGRWVAYASNESGRNEVYVRSFPDLGGKWQISQGGGTFPQWRGDSRELFYYGADGSVYAVPLDIGAVVTPGAAVPLFEARMLNGPNNAIGFRAQYDVSRDGNRFLVNTTTEQTAASPITVVVNWLTER